MATMHPMSRIISVSALPWEERQPGVTRKLLWEDPATQRRALLNRIEPSAQFARHRHVGDELVSHSTRFRGNALSSSRWS